VDPAYRPQSNGKVERLNHTINQGWADAMVYTGNQARLDALPGWVHAYNYHRPHTALGGRSPMQTLNNLPGNHS
jgi:transposase InsO family protein